MSVLSSDVLQLADYGFYPVRLHYPVFEQDRVLCSCGREDCKAQGKHPVGNQWGKSATQDPEVINEQWGEKPWNCGIILGLCHGIPEEQAIIDIEDDTLEGRAMADALLVDYPAPTYTSGKSLHRIYRWCSGLPPVANMTISGLEFRFGGKGKETQSVAPPSIHPSGKTYQWIEGKSPAEIPIGKLPQHVVDYLCEEYARQGSVAPRGASTTDATKFRSPMGKIGPGARHHSLLKYANSCWRDALLKYGINGLEEQDAIDQVWMWLAGANLLVCDPPKSEAELHTIFQSSQRFMLGEFQKEIEANTDLTDPQPAEGSDLSLGGWLHRHGIRMVADPRAESGAKSIDRIDEWQSNWSMKFVTKADEELVSLKLPDIDKEILMKQLEFESPMAVARKIQTETGGQWQLSRTFPIWDWESIWKGRANDKKRENGITRGLREYLANSAKVEEKLENSLAEQTESLIASMVGAVSPVMDKLDEAVERGHGMHTWTSRLKLTPMGDLASFKAPEDPSSGLYVHEERVWKLIKFDELMKRYRGSFGSGIPSRMLTECMEKLRYQKKHIRSGPLEGRWYGKMVDK